MSTTTVSAPSCGALARRAGERQRGLLVAADRARVEAVAVAHGSGELRAVGGVAHGAREDGGRVRRAVLVDRGAVARQDVEHALHRRVAEPPGRVDALAEPRDGRLAVQLARHGAVAHVGDEQPRGVRPDVDDGDAHELARVVPPAGR